MSGEDWEIVHAVITAAWLGEPVFQDELERAWQIMTELLDSE
jgi:hypothetical protein